MNKAIPKKKGLGILKIWIKRIQSDPECKGLPFIQILREAVRVKNATTRRKGFSATFLAFGWEPSEDIPLGIEDLVEPGWNPGGIRKNLGQLERSINDFYSKIFKHIRKPS